MRIWNTKNGYRICQLLSGRSNVFLVSGNNKNLIVDTGPAFMRMPLKKQLKKLSAEYIDLLILTHSHFDHAGNSRWMKEKYGARVAIHKSETDFLAKGENIIPMGTNPFTRILMNIFAERFMESVRYEPCRYDISVDSYLDLKDLGFNAHILHTPGHTEGSVSVIVDNEIALVGDTMVGVSKCSVMPPFANDLSNLVSSWERLLETDCRIFIPSHGTANDRKLVQKTFNKWKTRIK